MDKYAEEIDDFIPTVCNQSPDNGKAFCEGHIKELQEVGFEKTGLREFIRFSGADPDKYSKDSQKKVDEVIKRISKLLKKKVKSSVDVQNTAKLLQELQPTTADFSLTGGADFCNKCVSLTNFKKITFFLQGNWPQVDSSKVEQGGLHGHSWGWVY
jgi:K+/H+ antiporter YhaU regulatory subunit KhtT